MIRTRSIFLALALLAIAAPAVGRAQEREWVEDYTNEWSDDGYDVSVDMSDSGTVTFDSFREPLTPYGDWVVVGSYGRVWRPHVAAGWRPYYYGRWEWTSEGWLWVSDEPWGWAAYHYGRWAFEPGYGWMWVPGYQWAPAWVSWRYSGDVIGWAPLAPGLSIYVTSYPFYDDWWCFVPSTRFVGVPVYSVAYAPSYGHRWYRATSPAPPPRVRGAPAPGGRAPAPAWGGPAPRVIEQRTGRPVTPVRVVSASSPNARPRAGEVPVYRPEARPSARGGAVAGGSRGPRGSDVRGPGRSGDAVPAPGYAPRSDRGTPGWSRGPRGSEQAAPRGGGRDDAGPSRSAPAPSWDRGGSGGSAPRTWGGAPRSSAESRGGGAWSGGGGAPRSGGAPAGGGAVRGGAPAPSHGGGNGGNGNGRPAERHR